MLNIQHHTLNPNLGLSLGVVFCVIAVCFAGINHSRPPSPLPDSVSKSVFSSARAMYYLKAIAQQPHSTGTTENRKVRDYLVVELKALGLEPQVQTDWAINYRHQNIIAGIVHNVIVRIPGIKANNALLVAAHYDSTHTGPGGADDGASVAAILETLRTLKNFPPLQNDLICLFTDGEEAGLLGAEAFVAGHSWAKEVALALNFEYRGNQGPLVMFEASQGNGKLIEGLASVPHPSGNSLMYEIYKRLPNDTDLSVLKRAGIAGMNFAAIEGHTSYHTQLDRPELMQEASLQHEGETMLSLIHYFGNTDLAALVSQDEVYFDAPGLGMVHYPVSWVKPLSGALLALFGVMLVRSIRLGQLRPLRTLSGTILTLLMAPGVAGLCQLLWSFIKYLHPNYSLLLQGDTYNSQWYLLAFILLVIALFSAVQSGIRKWMNPIEFFICTTGGWLILLIAASQWMPGASFLFFWPLASVLIATGVFVGLQNLNKPSLFSVIVSIFGAAPGILILAPFIKLLFFALTPNQIGLTMGVLALFLGLLTPQIELLLRNFILPWVPLISGLGFLITGSLTSGFDNQHPQPNNLFYALDSVSGKALWLSTDRTLDSWTRTFFASSKQKRQVPEIFGANTATLWAAVAPTLPLKAPEIKVLGDSVKADIRTITLQVSSLRQAPELNVYLEGTGVISSRIENRIASKSLIPEWRFQGFGFLDKGVHIELTVKSGEPFKIRVLDFTYELPFTSFSPRPADMMTQPFGLSDTTTVVNTLTFH